MVSPVTTAMGDAMRRHGIEVLTEEHRALLKQATREPLSWPQLQHLQEIVVALEKLQAMRPRGDVQPEPEPEPEPAVSLCAVCDAPPGACEHNGARYLEPIVYEPVRNEDGLTVGHRVPEHERERWQNGPGQTRSATETPIPIADLVDAVGQLIQVSGPLERLMVTLHERDPLAVSRIVQRTLDDAATGKVHSLGGMLYTRLQDVSKT